MRPPLARPGATTAALALVLTLAPLGLALAAVPAPRIQHSAIWDPSRERMVMFGGLSSGTRLADVWALHPTSGTWSQMAPTGTPPSGRQGHTAIYDPIRDRMLVFGGDSGAPLREVWELSFSGTPAWTQLTPSNAASVTVRSEHGAIYDPVRDRMVVFGGMTSGLTPLNDTWALSLSGSPAWSALTIAGGSPPVRCDFAYDYDADLDRMVVFGGQNPSVPAATSQTLSLQFGAVNFWQQHVGFGGVPHERWGASGTYDAEAQRYLVFGGRWTCTPGCGQDAYNDVWDLTTPFPFYQLVTPTGGPPSDREQHTAVLDAANDRVIVFGGGVPFAPTNETWILTLRPSPTWTLMTPAVAVEPALGSPEALGAMVPNPARDGGRIAYVLKQSGPVRLSISDVQGREVAVLTDGVVAAGPHEARWLPASQGGLPAGVYFAKLVADGRVVGRRFVVVE